LEKDRSNLWAHLALLAVNLFYGANHLIAKGVMPKILGPNVFILIRVSSAALLFWIVMLLTKSREKIDRKDIPRLMLCALFGVAVNQLFFFNGLNLSSSINASIIMTMNPIMVVVLSFFLLKERISNRRIIGVFMGATGAVLLILASSLKSPELALGDLFLFVNAFSYAMYLVLVKPLMQKYKPLTIITYAFSIGLIYVLVFPLTIPELLKTNFYVITWDEWGRIAYVVICVTFLAYLLTLFGLRKLSPSVSSSYIYLQPVFVIIFAFLFAWIGLTADYTQSITFEKMGYMALIFAGVYVTSMKKKVL
jgi:drug/metabolite transporter (DMT)-like permease